MAMRCPDCGNFMRLIGTDEDTKAKGKHRSHYWCKNEGTYIIVPNHDADAARINRTDMSRAYTEFSGYLKKNDNMRWSWTCIFFKCNDTSEVGVCIGAIMGVHAVREKACGAWEFEVSTTACTRVGFKYESEAMAKQDRSRLLLVIEAYHVSDAENGTI